MAAILNLVSLALALSASATPLSTYSGTQRTNPTFNLAPLVSPSTEPHNLINNSYIVVLKDDTHPESFFRHIDHLHKNLVAGDAFFAGEGGLRHSYHDLGIAGHGFWGYAGMFSEDTIDAIRAQPEVELVERDSVMYALDSKEQRGAPWGLARISHRDKLRLSTFNRYDFDSDGGEGVDVYVIDTGIFIKHTEFEGRARWGKTMPQNDVDEDGNGHGTHCAGTIASRRYGVAKKANVVAVKVLGSNGSGSTSDVVGGVAWAANDAAKTKVQALKNKNRKYKGAVANMSLGGGKSTALDKAVNAAVESGMHFAVAAGNDNKDACNSSPAAADRPLTVGASTLGDERAYFSNWGKCVDVFAPGLNILSTWNGPSKDATNTISGTSMASPHTAGLMAYLLSIYPSASFDPPISKKDSPFVLHSSSTYQSLLQMAHATLPSYLSFILPILPTPQFAPVPAPGITTEQMKKAVISLSTKGVLSDIPKDTVNLLIYNNATGLDDLKLDGAFWAGL